MYFLQGFQDTTTGRIEQTPRPIAEKSGLKSYGAAVASQQAA